MPNFRPPTPPPRRNVIPKFTSVVAVKDNSQGWPYCKWELDRQLASHLELCQQRDPQLLQLCQKKDEIGLMGYWLEEWPKQLTSPQEKRLVKNHIFAYLETPRYWAALNRFNAYNNLDYPQETWASYMSIAAAFASDPKQILDAFQKYDRNRDTRLEKFFQTVLERKMQEGYYKESKTGKYSPWYILKKVSKKQLKKGLQVLGLQQEQIVRYLFARDCLFKVYRKPGKRWLEPSRVDYQRGADFYNRHYKEGPRISWEMLAAWMADCINALQPFRTCSLEEAIARPGVEMQISSQYSDPLKAIEDEEFAAGYLEAALREILGRTLDNFEATARQMLELRYGKELTETQVGKIVGLHQSNVSRKCQHYIRQLLDVAAEWLTQHNLEIDEGKHNGLITYIKAWLKEYYQGLERLAIEPILIFSPYKPEKLLDQAGKQTPDSPELEQLLKPSWAAMLENEIGRQQPYWELPALSKWLYLNSNSFIKTMNKAGWQPYSEVFNPAQTALLARRIKITEKQPDVVWAKQMNLGTESQEKTIALTINLRQEPEGTISILPQVRPVGRVDRQLCLPEGLQMIVLDESGEIFDEVRAGRASNLIQLDGWLSDSPGGRFSIQLVLGEASVTEQFVI